MSTVRARVFEEHTQLGQRIDRLRAFIISEQFEALPDVERADLREQLKHMQAYFNVLSNRVSRLCTNA